MYCSVFSISVIFFLKINCEGDFKQRVYAGQRLDDGTETYLVKLNIDRLYLTGTCTASILTKRYLITAAHCVISSNIYSIDVTHHYWNGGKTKKIADVDLNKIVLHPGYITGDEPFENREVDLAILRTKSSIAFNKHVQPIRLAASSPRPDTVGFLSGYGLSDDTDYTAIGGYVDIIECPFEGFNLICAYDITRAGDGDSGGTLLVNDELAGVVTGSCNDVLEDKPCLTVFTSIPLHRKWIMKQLI